MLKRNPTKIELKLEDIQELNFKLRDSLDGRKNTGSENFDTKLNTETPVKSRQEVIEERIGYTPRQRRAN